MSGFIFSQKNENMFYWAVFAYTEFLDVLHDVVHNLLKDLESELLDPQAGTQFCSQAGEW